MIQPSAAPAPDPSQPLEAPGFALRGATTSDLEALLALSRHLNTVNLPHERGHLQSLLECSEASFRGELPPPRCKYVFLLWDEQRGHAVGSSSIIAQLGRKDAPYIYFDVLEEERYSAGLDRHFHHELLRLGFSYDGPTELGGLVMQPEYRRAPTRLGRFISYSRFAFIAARRSLFQSELLAELLPPLEADGTSHLWEALGRRFTNMSYAEADLMSSHDKDFIRDLFPRGDIHTTLLNEQARAVVGQVGERTLGVERLLRAIGFRYAWRVDPFDGGPHFVAATDEVPLIRATRAVDAPTVLEPDAAFRAGIVMRLEAGPPYMRAMLSRVGVADSSALPEQTLAEMRRTWGWSPGQTCWLMDWT
jgi:arginine N-succinyltransferase